MGIQMEHKWALERPMMGAKHNSEVINRWVHSKIGHGFCISKKMVMFVRYRGVKQMPLTYNSELYSREIHEKR